MSLFGTLLCTALDVVTTPIEIVKDVATIGGALTDEPKPYTMKHLEKLADDAEEVRDEAKKL